MAGVAGFEPTSARVKVSCLTAWRHPNIKLFGVNSGIRTHDLQGHNLSTRIIKTTALVKMINVTEVLKVGQQIIGQFYRQPDAAFWVYFVIFLLYFLVCWPFSLLAKQLEKRWA